MRLTIQSATGADLPSLVKAFGQPDYFAERINRPKPAGLLLVGWLAGQPVGDVYLRFEPADEPELRKLLPDVPLIQHLEVLPDLRNQGIGSALIQTAEQLLRERGHPRVALGVGLDNRAAARLYQRHGYEQWPYPPVLTTYVEYLGNGRRRRGYETCHILVKDLTDW